MKANWIGHILRKNCPLKHIIEGKIEGTGRRGKGSKQLQDDLRKREDTRNWKRNQYIAVCEELALQGAMELS